MSIDPAFADRCTTAAANLSRLAELGARPDTDADALMGAGALTAALLADPEALLAAALVTEQQRAGTADRERAAFAAGFDAGWNETGEGYNGEYVSERKDKEDPGWYERARAQALAAHLEAVGRPPTPRRFRQVNDLDTSTRRCPCGGSITWSGCDPALQRWLAEHRPHVDTDEVEVFE